MFVISKPRKSHSTARFYIKIIKKWEGFNDKSGYYTVTRRVSQAAKFTSEGEAQEALDRFMRMDWDGRPGEWEVQQEDV